MKKVSLALSALALGAILVISDTWKTISTQVGVLLEPDLTFGPWYARYVVDYVDAHPNRQWPLAGVMDADGSQIWVTDHPEWDRGWFEKRGNKFPATWATFESVFGQENQ